ncbi:MULTISPECIES: hypothetical protein [Butyricimonas]|uniref:hypothetical protein n=1 Tax=Butyricimonas TaxID=574697 RepID=UPI000B3AE3BC|nr:MULTISPECIES: hypothetical protein [Butyricimonas]OUN64228.1 hypothetical protein B5G13_14555 [Butyricimonas sp. An62]
MKKYSILFMAIATMLFISCSKDDNDYDYENGTWSTVEIAFDVTKPPMTVKLSNSTADLYIHTQWGDGSSSENTYEHTYTTAGRYNIVVKARNMEVFNIHYNYSSIHFKDCPDLIYNHHTIGDGTINDTITVPKAVKFENCPKLTIISLTTQKVTNLEIVNCPKLETLDCSVHQLQSLNLDCPALTKLDCSMGPLEELNLKNLPLLESLNCSYNQLKNIDLKNNDKLKEVDCSWNQFSNITFKGLGKLEDINCSNNQLTTLNVEDCYELISLDCKFNKLTELDVSNNTNLIFLTCTDNYNYADHSSLETIWIWEGAKTSGWLTMGVEYKVKQ